MLTSIGFLSRNPTPPVLSTAVNGIGVIGSFFVTVASAAVIVGGKMSRLVTVKVKLTGVALWLALSVALKVIVFVLPTSSAVVVIVIVLIFSVSVSFTFVAVAFALINLLPYFVRKSELSRLTILLSLAVKVNVTFSPSTTVWLAGEIVNVGGWLSSASSTVTGTFTFSDDPSGYVTCTTALPTFPGLAVDGLLTTFNVPGP